MRKELILSALAMLLGMGGVQAQMVMDLQGPWDFALGDSAHYDDYVVLPGSLLTNDKGHEVDIHTQWTGSLYDSSYFYNPYMEPYRRKGQMKFPFFLTDEVPLLPDTRETLCG